MGMRKMEPLLTNLKSLPRANSEKMSWKGSGRVEELGWTASCDTSAADSRTPTLAAAHFAALHLHVSALL